MRIAVIGAGVSGLVAAYRLQAQHEVVLFEADPRLGGHAHTVDVEEDGRTVAMDTGFLVFNPRTYPKFIALLEELGVAWADSDMSLSVRSDARDFEYNCRDLGALYVQRKNLLSPRFHRMVWDVLRFHREAPRLLESDDETPLDAWLAREGYSRAFAEDHLGPLVRAVWSASPEVAAEFPARFLVRFFANHNFLQVNDQPRWRTIPGGSRRYVEAIAARLRSEVRTAARVTRVERSTGGVLVTLQGHAAERFDHVVLACHSDQALDMLASPTEVERRLLGAIPYQPNEAVLHTDERLMPRARRAWASWNAHLDAGAAEGAAITYWLNLLQPLATRTNYFVTLNRSESIRPERVIKVMRYAHPVFSTASVAAQAERDSLIDLAGISYCGAYLRNGFHEDGVVSALRVVERLGTRRLEQAA
jgi:predicted NAD/FAD-binding protein